MITNRFHATRDSYQIPAAVVAGGGGIALGRERQRGARARARLRQRQPLRMHAVIHAPEGWALCDGQEGRPDLRGRFVRGARDIGGLCETGGTESHDHKLVSGKVARITGLVTAGTSALTGAEKAALPHLTPFVQLLYIVKLDETH